MQPVTICHRLQCHDSIEFITRRHTMTEAEKQAFLDNKRQYFITNCGHKKVKDKWRVDDDNPNLFYLGCMNCGSTICVEFFDNSDPKHSVYSTYSHGCVTMVEEDRIRRTQKQ